MISTEHSQSPLTRKVLRLLDGLRRTQAGNTIYKHIETLLSDNEKNHENVEEAYARLLNMVMDALAERLPPGSPLHVQIKLVQMHVSPPLSSSELDTLQACLALYGPEETEPKQTDEGALEKALAPLLEEYSQESEPAPPPSEKPKPAHTIDQNPVDQRVIGTRRRSTDRPEQSAERRVDTAYRQHLHQKRESIQRIQQTLSRHVADAIRQNEEFGVLLEVELDAMRQAETTQELDILRKTLITEVEKLQHGHQTLTGKLEDTHKYLQLVEADSQQLSDELTRVHLLSLTDELTSLPNRRAFMRRLEDEVGRVQRYGNALSLVLIDLDNFKPVNDAFGHAGGDEVLRSYGKQILSIFRHHDMVARYGGEEFAVLLPNTDSEGAFAAVSKVRKRAQEITIEVNKESIQVPTFSAGVALYQPGETPTDLIERADNALYRAKRLGRDRIEMATTKDSDAVLR